LKLTINNLSFNYNGLPALEDVALEVGLGEVLSIVGPNGSGKSTLLKCINRILKTKQNTVMIDGRDVGKIRLKDLAKIMGYVPQISLSTFPFSVFDVVLMGRRPYIQWNDLAMRYFNELSGGEQQKVIIARALAQQPQILLLDEPTSSLDIKHQLEIICILRSLAQSKDCSIIVAMHDLNLASRFSDRMLMLKEGCIFAVGDPVSVLTEKNIEAVYGVKSRVTKSVLDIPQVTPLISETNGFWNSKMPPQTATK